MMDLVAYNAVLIMFQIIRFVSQYAWIRLFHPKDGVRLKILGDVIVSKMLKWKTLKIHIILADATISHLKIYKEDAKFVYMKKGIQQSSQIE